MSGRRAYWMAMALAVAVLIAGAFRAQRRIEASKVVHAVEQTTLLAMRQGRPDPRLLRANAELLEDTYARVPVEVQLLTALGAQYRLLGRSEQAIATYRRALELEPRPEIYLNLAQELARTGERQAAAENLETARRLAPALVRPRAR